MKFKTASELFEASPFTHVSVYGASGTGKSTWAARAPRPLIALTEDQGLVSIQHANPDAIVVQIDTYTDLENLFDLVATAKQIVLENGQPALEVNGAVFQTFVVDSGTDLQRLAFQRFLGLDDSQMTLKATYDAISTPQWGVVAKMMHRLWGRMNKLRCNTILLHLAETIVTQDRTYQVPLLQGRKTFAEIGQYFNAQGVSFARTTNGGALEYGIQWAGDSADSECKPAPGWPAYTYSTSEPGVTTLGSLAMYSAPDGVIVPHAEGDDPDIVAAQIQRIGVAPPPPLTARPERPGAMGAAAGAAGGDSEPAPKRKKWGK